MSGFAAIYGEVLRIGERLSAAWAGQLTTLLGRLPEGRVGNLDQIGAARMAALEALAARLPDVRVANLDQIGAARMAALEALATRLPASRVALLDALGVGVPALRVQRGVFVAAGSVTIPAVDPAKAFVLSVSKGSNNLATREYSAVLANATTVTADGPCEWQLVEGY